MLILGLSFFYHNSAVYLLKNGGILFAAQEERFSRKKHAPRFPINALKAFLKRVSLWVLIDWTKGVILIEITG